MRTFSDLNENSHEYQAKYSIDFGAAGAPTTVKFGGLYRATGRDAQSLSYNISSIRLTDAQRELPLGADLRRPLHPGRPERLRLRPALAGRIVCRGRPPERRLPDGRGPARRAAQAHRRRALRERPAGRGCRLDARDSRSRPASSGTTGCRRSPNVKLTDAQQLRLSASRTLARPEYRELSPIISRDVIGGENVQGDENLQRTNVTNLDLRWEMYPAPGRR